MKLIMSLTYVALFLLPIFLISSCGGGKIDAPTPSPVTSEVINGIVVPLEPDPVKNNATLAGVDSNNNGVRDDAERKIAKKSSSASIFDATIETARKYQKILVDPTLTEIQLKQEFIQIDCHILKNREMAYNQTEIAKIISNSSERRKAYTEIAIKTGGYIIDSDTDCNK